MSRTPLKRTGFALKPGERKPRILKDKKEIPYAKAQKGDYVWMRYGKPRKLGYVKPGEIGIVTDRKGVFDIYALDQCIAEQARFFTSKTPKGGKPKERCPSVAVLDKLFSDYIRMKSNFECELWKFGDVRCSSQMQCSHIISRVYQSTRWDVGNAICACAVHHRLQHNQPTLQTEWIKDILGEDHLDALHERHILGRKPTTEEKIEMAKWFRAQIAEMQGK